MAVVKLKLISVSGSMEDYSETLLRCISESEFHMDDAGELLASGSRTRRSTALQNEVNPYAPLLARLDSLTALAGIKINGSSIKSIAAQNHNDTPDTDDAQAKFISYAESAIDDWQKELDRITGERTSLEANLHEDEGILGQLYHLKEANADLDRVFACEFFRFRFGHMPRESYDNLSTYTQDINDMYFYASSVEKREVWGLYFMPRTKSAQIDQLFESLHFERVRISERAHGTPAEAIVLLEAEMKETKARLAELKNELTEFNSRIIPELTKIYDSLSKLDRIFELHRKVIHTSDSFTLAGWIAADHAEAFKSSLEAAKSVTVTLENAHTSGGIVPPTKLKNPAFLGGYEDFVKMYGLPSYNEIDPTPIVAITYFIFFGMMFGDIGQGAVIILVGALMWFLKKLSLGKVLMTVGVSSMIFGAFYGSVFGMEDIIHGFNPNENINTVLFASVGIGVVMIVAMIVVNIINGIRQKNVEKVFFSQNGLPGLVMYIGAVIIVLAMLNYVKFSIPTGVLVALIVVALLLIFLREPLTKLVEGRGDAVPESKLDFVLENFFELFEVVLSFLTNTISFIRIGAFALSHVGMMSVVFLLAETATGYNPVILIIGNLFVIGFEGMIVCIQVLRLEFYELFGRFYEGDGRAFEPAGEIPSNGANKNN